MTPIRQDSRAGAGAGAKARARAGAEAPCHTLITCCCQQNSKQLSSACLPHSRHKPGFHRFSRSSITIFQSPTSVLSLTEICNVMEGRKERASGYKHRNFMLFPLETKPVLLFSLCLRLYESHFLSFHSLCDSISH